MATTPPQISAEETPSKSRDQATRILSTNDLPKSTFSGEPFDERRNLLRDQTQRAGQGDAGALYTMGLRYLEGIDVDKNEKTAKEYFEAARKRGHPRAKAKLDEMTRSKSKEKGTNQPQALE